MTVKLRVSRVFHNGVDISANFTYVKPPLPPALERLLDKFAFAGAVIPSELTLLTKTGGPLTKRISLREDGSVKSDGSACVMAHGLARRIQIANANGLAALIGGLSSNQALALGRLRDDLPEDVKIVTRDRVINGVAQPGSVARTGNNILYREGHTAWALLDYDAKGMPSNIAADIEQHGGFLAVMQGLISDLENIARVSRASTSSGLYHLDTGERLPSSGGVHLYITVRDGADIERFLRTLHDRCWLAGFGWYMIGAGGQLLERSIIDRMVGGPERLVFEGNPILVPPVAQDHEARRPIATEGTALDTSQACTIPEKARLRDLKAKWEHRLAPEAARARSDFIERQAQRLVARRSVSIESARQIIARQCEGVLLPDVELPFDDRAGRGIR